MAVEAVVGDVELAAQEPFRMGQIPFENFLGRLEPVQHFRLLGPKFLRIGRGLLIYLLVFFERLDAGFLAEILWRRDGLLFEYVRVEFLHGSSGWPGARPKRLPAADGRDLKRPLARPYVIEERLFGQEGE